MNSRMTKSNGAAVITGCVLRAAPAGRADLVPEAREGMGAGAREAPEDLGGRVVGVLAVPEDLEVGGRVAQVDPADLGGRAVGGRVGMAVPDFPGPGIPVIPGIRRARRILTPIPIRGGAAFTRFIRAPGLIRFTGRKTRSEVA